MSIATLSSKFQLSIPKDIREAMHLKPGQQMSFLRVGKSLRLVPVLPMEELFGLAKGAEAFVRDRSTRREDILPAASLAKTPATVKKVVVKRRIGSGKALKSTA